MSDLTQFDAAVEEAWSGLRADGILRHGMCGADSDETGCPLCKRRKAALESAIAARACAEERARSAKLVEALKEAEKDLVACEWNINVASSRGDAGWEGVPERLRSAVSNIRCVLAHYRDCSP